MTLRELLEEVDVIGAGGDLDAVVLGLSLDSRRVRPGDAFFALPGARSDGAAFARAAVEAGAVAVVSAPGVAAGGAAHVEVAEPRLALAQAAGRFHGHPSRSLRVVGVTGTNGKTTTTWMLEALFRGARLVPGVIGTTGVRVAGDARPSEFTTPEAPDLQSLLAEMRDTGVRAVAMEVSSHALVQRRAWGIAFDAVVFTNLSQDHLDYHGTMDAYLDAKAMLFDGRNGGGEKPARSAVINADDPAAERIADAARRSGARVVTFGSAERADVRILGVESRAHGLDVRLVADGRPLALRLPMLGRYNAWNAAGAYAAARAAGVEPLEAEALERMPAVPGRLEPVTLGPPFAVVVDYAHTPDALERALAACREHATGRVLLVFGCGGDRDRGKRPRMGAAAAAGAAIAWVTNDNPRGEDPDSIAREILAGAASGALRVELDRRAAIAAAIGEARPGDVVLVAGKGHETTQTIGERVLPFDDRAVAREMLAARADAR